MAKLSTENRNLLKGLAFLSPWILGFLVFTLLPIAMSLYYSFCDYSLLQKPVYCGLDNYVQLLHEPLFYKVLRNSFYYAGLSLPLGLIVSLGIALLLNYKIPGQQIFRTIVFIPSLVPTVASAVLWMWLFNSKLGMLNALLGAVHIPGPGWLTDPSWIIPSLVLMGLWGVGNTTVIYLAGLQDVPRELYEAADLDGANALHQLIHVTLPTISPVIFFNLVMGIISVLQVFDAPYIMTPNGGTARSAYLLTQYLYDSAFTNLHMGYASAIAWIQLLIVLLLTALAFWTSRYWVHYQGK